MYRCGKDLNPEEVKRRAALANEGSVVQTTTEDAASNEVFVEMLAAQTMGAESSKSLLARKPEMDLLLRLAGTTQISRAIKEMGAAQGEPFLLVVAGSKRPRQIRGLAALELPRRELTRSELQKVEKAALLNAQRA